MGKIIILLIGLILSEPVLAQQAGDTSSIKKLEFKSGLPSALTVFYKNLNSDKYSFSEINIVEINQAFYLLVKTSPDGSKSYYLINNQNPGKPEELDFTTTEKNSIVKKELLNTGNEFYVYTLILKKDGENIFSFIEKKLKGGVVADVETGELKNSESGFIFEFGMTSLEKVNESVYNTYNYSSTYTIKAEEHKFNNFSFGLYYSTRFFLDNSRKLEIRPGIILSNFSFSGLECGLFLRQKLWPRFFASFGLNTHLTIAVPEDNGNSHSNSTTLFFILPVFSVGFDFNNDLSSMLSFYTSLGDKSITKNESRNFGYYDGDLLKSKTETKNMSWGLKLGLEIKL